MNIPYWNPQWATLASALLEIAFGASMLQGFLVLAGVQNAMPRGGAILLVVGGFLAVEGMIRFAIATQGSGVVSLPVVAIWRAWKAIASLARRGNA